ncbi:MAG: pilus assembly protein PilM [Candidatus Pacebacteria bacterium]|nr:pilus assembly protein PilM [Candidatus Paceibacterota bacterium]
MQENVAGIHIANGYITAAEADFVRKGEVRVKRLGWATYEPDMTNDELAGVIRRLWTECGISTSTVITALRSKSQLTKYFSYPFMTDAELKSALYLEAEESLLLSEGELCVDWHIGRREKPAPGVEGGGVSEGVLVAAPRTDVERDLGLLRQARLFPIVMDTDIMAIANYYLATSNDDGEMDRTCMIYLTPMKAYVCTFFGKHSMYPRTVNLPGGLGEHIEDLTESLQEDIRYCIHKLHKKPMERIVLMDNAGTGELVGSFLQDIFAIPVEHCDAWAGIKMRKRLARSLQQEDSPGSLALPAVGLALRSGTK